MFAFRRPPESRIRRYLATQSDLPFSYGEVGATWKDAPPRGYAVDRYRVRLGEGEEAFGRAKRALRGWQQFDLGWTEIVPRGAPMEVGTTVAVLARHHGFWSHNAARVVYLVEEAGHVDRFGFAHGTLPGHGEKGEERFVVEWDHGGDCVHYDVLAFSRPKHPLAWLGYPLVRSLQRRFARDSKAAMVRATSPPG